jgi:hypothetical protein
MPRQQKPSDSDSTEYWWYNIRTRRVEFGLQSKSLDRVGPFETEEQAKNAPQLIAERAAKWEKSEREEN